MTIINGFELDNIKYIENDIKNAIKNNKPIDEKLHMVICVSNAVQYASRYILAKKFIKRIEEEEKNVILYIVELAYDLPNKKPQEFYVTDINNRRHLQLRTSVPLWHKENLLNICIQKLLPKNWKAVCWADADIIFDDPNFAINTLKILNGCRDIVQNFSHCIDMDQHKNAMNIFSGFGYQYTHKKPYNFISNPQNQYHPGFVWSCTRTAYDKMKGLFEYGILGSGDHHMCLAWIHNGIKSVNKNATDDYKNAVFEYQQRCNGLKIGYVPGIISHEFHGKKSNRFYNERWNILINNKYAPSIHVTKNKDGLLIPSDQCPQELLTQIYNYFSIRKEDENFLENKIT